MIKFLVTAPSEEPVTLDEVKAFLRLEAADEEVVLSALIVAARLWAEKYTGRVFVTQSWKVSLDAWPKSDCLALPCAPVNSVSAVTLYDDADNATLLAASSYYVDAEGARLVLRRAATRPVPERCANGIGITVTCGYGAASAVPETLKLAIKQLVAHWFAHRGEAEEKTSLQPPLVILALLDPYRVIGAGL